MTADFRAVAVTSDEQGQLAMGSSPTGGGAQLLNGILKLGQRWLMEFLTEKGSMPLLPQRGCSFLNLLRRRQLGTEVDVFHVFALAAGEVAQALIGDEREDDPNDERYQSAVLEQLIVHQRYLMLHVRLTSQAGAERLLRTPVAL